ncbi:MAG: TraR/DksA C4-type zinc finger protein [Anaerolineae bacterium]|nr:TraR/DksA C4-type zinc finger protein [Anaerolineae bacterium]
MVADIHHNLKTALEKQREQLQTELAESGTPPADGMGYGTHQADDGTVAFEQAADLAMRENAKRMLYQIERALFRMEEGTYGICRQCGNKIDPARLKAIPYTRYCLHCAARAQE